MTSNLPLAGGTPEDVISAARLVQSGEVFSLDLPLDHPPLATPPRGRPLPVHRPLMHNNIRSRGTDGYVVVNDDVVEIALQGSSHWDALAHWGAIEPNDPAVFYAGRELDETGPEFGAKSLGIGLLGGAVVRRGVLVDMPQHLNCEAGYVPPHHVISRTELEDALTAQRVRLEPGDIVCVYTGFQAQVLDVGFFLNGDDKPPVSAGLAQDTAELFADSRAFAVVSDNSAVEGHPMVTGRFHTLMLKHYGIHLGELWRLDEVAAACARDGRREFLLTSSPIALAQAFGSPANAIAIR